MNLIETVRTQRPLVHAITNYVTMEWVARGLLATGARPLMARDAAEAAQAAGAASALVLNLGTWSQDAEEAMLLAAATAQGRGIPVVLDPVGAGGIATRTQAALALLGTGAITAVRGNAGEILALAGVSGQVRGVDSLAGTGAELQRAAMRVARRFGCTVAVTGPIDLVTDGHRSLTVRAGHPWMAQIPGAGCLATAVIAAALGAVKGQEPALEITAQALLWGGLAGEEAAATAAGPGSFAATFLDRLAAIEALPSGRIAPPLADRLSLYVIVGGTTPLPVVEAALSSGMGAVQFREKKLPFREQLQAAMQVQALCRKAGALFLINDRVDLALAVGADGVHLGQDDMPVATGRRLLGPQAIIGATCETAAEARIAQAEGADYIGSGPVYATPSKADAGDPYGPAVIQRVSEATRLPVVGIGGIGIGGAAPVVAAGACGVSVISSVVGAADPGAAARTILAEVLEAKEMRLS